MYDAIVIGLGGMGSASLFEIAHRGLRVLGIERFDVPHRFGSSHGETRIIRLAYYESEKYVPLLRRAYELWEALQERCAEKLLYKTQSLDIGPKGSRTFSRSLESCLKHSLKYEELDAAAVNKRFQGYRLEPEMMAVLQPDGGYLLPERCVTNYVRAAVDLGAEVVTREKVTRWETASNVIRVHTASGRYEAERLVITAGPWARDLVSMLETLAIPERQVVLWTQPNKPTLFRAECFPVFNFQVSDDESDRYYGVPSHEGSGFKIGKYHHRCQQGSPEALMSRDIDDRDEQLLRGAIQRFFPDAAGRTINREQCLFTVSPDEHFILDRHPDAPQVAIAAGFSGHGFKFCSVVGEIMADLVTSGDTSHDIADFRMNRFS